jgi:DNA-directed RNA polymerase
VAKGIINRNIGTDLGAVLAKIPMKLIRKGISKRGSMTKAYDAGVNCIADIIYTDCYNAGMTTKYGITKSIARKLSKDLVDTYNTICSGPVAIKNYLQSVVKYVMKDEGHSCVTWSTPSGFPVISEKWVTRQKDVSLFYKNKKIVLVYREQTEIPAIHEVMSGISPNYVHSMDASHMSLVINELHDMGITSFGAIHDSYSVHADDVEDLVRVTKSVFINMYDRDIFGHIRKDMAGIGYTEHPPKLGRLDISKVVDSDYFFC